MKDHLIVDIFCLLDQYLCLGGFRLLLDLLLSLAHALGPCFELLRQDIKLLALKDSRLNPRDVCCTAYLIKRTSDEPQTNPALSVS